MAGALRTLVVNADDFGLSEGINRGILSAFRQGILRSASIVPNGMAFEDAVRIASETPDLDIGIHLSLVGERSLAPIRDVRGLASDGGILPSSYATFMRDYALRRFGLRQVRAEIEAQVARVLDAGLRPSHIDSHQHLHVLPGIIDVVIDAAKASGIRIIRLPSEHGGIGGRGIGQRALLFLCQRAAPKLREAGIRFADRFWGFGISGHMSEETLAGILDRLGPGVNEIMCHPGFSDAVAEKRYRWHYHWDQEVAALCSDAIWQNIEDRKIRLVGFSEAWEPAG